MANIIKVSEEDRNKVQRADVEVASYQNIISYIIANNMDISNERFKEYEKRHQDAVLAFELVKNELQKKYLSNVKASHWNLDYVTCELSYYE